MVTFFSLFFTLVFTPSTFAAGPGKGEPKLKEESCPTRIVFSSEESLRFRLFAMRLESLRAHFGKDSFEIALSKILQREDPEAKVTEVSPVFFERVRNLVDQQYLKHSVAKLIGLKSPQWRSFEKTMRDVTQFGEPIKYFREDSFAKDTLELIRALESSANSAPSASSSHSSVLGSIDQRKLEAARAVTSLANMYIYIERWNFLNKEIRKHQINRTLLIGLSVTAGAVLVASTIYAGSIVAAAGAIGASFSTDVVVASQLARLGQVMAGVGLGAVGAPTAVLLKDSTSILFEAQMNSKNNNTLYACELDKLIAEWKNRGISPYLNASLIGGSIGFGGGMLTLSKLGAKVVLYATTFGVGVVQLYAVSVLSDHAMNALAEFRLAREAMDRGDKERAIYHLHRAREHTKSGKEAFLDTLLVAILTGAISKDFSTALKKGEEMIRALYANSADTLPQAVDIGISALKEMMAQNVPEPTLPQLHFPSGNVR